MASAQSIGIPCGGLLGLFSWCCLRFHWALGEQRTESQLVAVIISFGALLVLWLVGLVSQGHTSVTAGSLLHCLTLLTGWFFAGACSPHGRCLLLLPFICWNLFILAGD